MTEYGASRIRIFSPTGVNLLTITTPYTPGGVAIGSDGLIYVVHYNAGAISRYSASGTDLGLFFASSVGGSADFLKFDATGNLYLVGFQPGRSIRRISPTGDDLGNFVTGDFCEGIALDRSGSLYVGNYLHFIIEKFSSSGDDLGTFAAVDDPGSSYGLAFDTEGNLYAVNHGGGNIRKFSPTGVDLGIFASAA